LKRHNVNEVIKFLKDYLHDKEHALRNMILIDKTHPKVDQLVVAMFRITMAIKTLEEGKEVIELERSKQGAKKSRQLYKRNSSSDCGPRQRKNSDNDGEDRIPRYPAQRAA
jgi:hypothetical protein